MSSTRILTGGLATLAVSATFSFAATAPSYAASGDDRPCGLPAVGAVYTTVVVDPVFRTVPAVTHTEWRWQRDVTRYEFEYSKVISPARTETDWTRQLPGETEYLFTRTVIDQAAVPAVPGTPEVGHWITITIAPAVTVTEDEYIQRITGKTRWESPDWGAQNGNGNGGWEKTGNTREREITPAVTQQQWVVDVPATPGTPAIPEVSHVESQWAASSPGADWSGPQDSRTTPGTTEQQTTAGDPPAGDGWVLTATRNIAAVIDTVWAATAPDGYTATGDSRVAGTDHEETDATSATAPAGDGWTAIAESAVTVVDSPASQVLVTPGSVTQVLVTPAQPATAPCVQPPTDPPTDPGTGGGGGSVAGPQAGPEPTIVTPAAQVAPVAVLPNTGGVPFWLAPTGLAAMLAGAVLIRTARRRVPLS